MEKQFDAVLAEESRIKRNPRFTDTRVHAILYFVQPTGHGLREPDIEFLQRLAPKANVIPVLSKADGLTTGELQLNKQLVMEDIRRLQIPVYGFPGGDGFQYGKAVTTAISAAAAAATTAVATGGEKRRNGKKSQADRNRESRRRNSRMGVYDDLYVEDKLHDDIEEDENEEDGNDDDDDEEEGEDDDEFVKISKQAKGMVPFAVVGASDIDEHQGLLTRRYAWGAIDVEDPRVSDISMLRKILTQTHVSDLRDTTEYVLYENYRTHKLSQELAEEVSEEAESVVSGEEASSSSSMVTHMNASGTPSTVLSSSTGNAISSSSTGALLAREQQIWASEQRLKDTESKLARDVAARRAEIAAQEQELKRLELELLTKAAAMSLGNGRRVESSQSIGY